MAINPRDETVYDNKIDESDLANYPYGKARNITTPGDGTGTPWDQIFINELWGYFQATLVEANITPDGNPETVQASQYLNAMRAVNRADTTSAKAWVNFSGTGTVSISDSFNVSSVTDLGGGQYRVNYAQDFDNTDYAVLVSRVDAVSDATRVAGYTSRVAGSVTILTKQDGLLADTSDVSVLIFSN